VYLFLRMGACLSLAMPAAALENMAGFKALRRSWKLTRGSRLRIMFTWLAIFAMSWIASSIPQFMLWGIMSFIGRGLHLVVLARQLYLPVAYTMLTIIHALLGPIFPIAITLFYYDQRIRMEGYDIERMMDAAGLISPILTAPVAPAEEPQLATPAAAEETHS
ncbi:MAG: hypothetical protein WBQ94_24020, partial [Terracidiphilus sp.]